MRYGALLFIFWVSLPNEVKCQTQDDVPFIVFLVDARGLDYSNTKQLIKTIRKHPSDGSKNGDVGHAWVYIEGTYQGRKLIFEGGHSAERDLDKQPGYLASVLEGCKRGEKNPIRHFYDRREDGYLERGSGGHKATIAVRYDLTEEQFVKLIRKIAQRDYTDYSLVDRQCTHFLIELAKEIGLDLDVETQVIFSRKLKTPSGYLQLWEDPKYAVISLATPEALQLRLKQLAQLEVLKFL